MPDSRKALTSLRIQGFFYVPFITFSQLFKSSSSIEAQVKPIFLEEKEAIMQAQPGYRLAIPLFLATCIPYVGAILYDYVQGREPDQAFVWFGGFYLALGGLYILKKVMHRKVNG